MGLKGDLTAGEIVEQLVHAQGVTRIKNVVFMVRRPRCCFACFGHAPGAGPQPLTYLGEVATPWTAETYQTLFSQEVQHGVLICSTCGVVTGRMLSHGCPSAWQYGDFVASETSTRCLWRRAWASH